LSNIIVLPPDANRKGVYDRAAAIPLKFLHGDGSVTSPDPTQFGEEILPPNAQRAIIYERATAESVKYLFPDGSVRDGEGLTEASTGGGGMGGTVRWFTDITERDQYFTENPDELKRGISVGVGNPVAAFTYDGTQWLTGALAFRGADGREVEIQSDGTDIQWRYAGETAWTNIVPLADLKGDPGREIELRVFSGILQWRYVGTTTWTNLFVMPETGTYEYTQTAASDVWNIQHNLGGTPVTILAVDNDGNEIVGQRDAAASTNNLLIYRFSEPIAGKAFIKF
jgi:hypothetical protein